jgi:hypothetical protein
MKLRIGWELESCLPILFWEGLPMHLIFNRNPIFIAMFQSSIWRTDRRLAAHRQSITRAGQTRKIFFDKAGENPQAFGDEGFNGQEGVFIKKTTHTSLWLRFLAARALKQNSPWESPNYGRMTKKEPGFSSLN